MKYIYRLFIIIAVCAFCSMAINAQQLSKTQSANSINRQQLNKILSTTSPLGPLGSSRQIAPADQIALLWSEPPSTAQPGSGSPDAYHFQIFSYLQNSGSLPLNQRLSAGGSLSGDSVTDTFNGASHPAIGGNKHSVVLAGDMTGSGYDELVSVWETDDPIGATSAAKVFATAQPINQSNLSFTNSGISGEILGYVTPSSSSYDGKICAQMADLLGDGKKELVAAFHDPTNNQVKIVVYGYGNSSSHLTFYASTSDMPVTTSPSSYSLISLTCGDFSGDGRDEIALAGFKSNGSLYIKIYEMDSNYNLTAKGEQDFPAYNSGAVCQLVMASGYLNGGFREDIALALTSAGINYNDQNSIIYIAQPDTSLNSISVSIDSSATKYAIQTSNNLPATSIACGDLNGDGRDEIVLAAQNYILVFDAQQNGNYLQPVFQTSETVNNGAQDGSDYQYSSSFLKVTALDQSRNADIVVLRDEYNDDGTNAYQALDLYAFSDTSTDNSIKLAEKATNTGYMAETTTDDPNFRRHYSLALGDFNGSSLTLGQPVHFAADSIAQPLVILNAPPVHFDVFNDTSYDICAVFNNGKNSNAFQATYTSTVTNTEMMETNLTSSWGIGASLSGDASYLGVKVSASLDTHYGQNFSKVSNSSYTNTVSINVAAQKEDEIYALVTNYDLWEYPVMDSGKVKGHVLVTVPSPPIGEWFDTETWTAYSFIPDHIVGNILSYNTYSGSLSNNPYLAEKIKGSLSNGFELGTGNFTWSLTTQDFTSNKVDTTKSFNLNVSADVQVGAEFGGFGASVKAGVSGDYSNSNLTSHTSSVTNQLNLTVSLGSIDQTIGEDQYIVYPYSYWADNGALVIDYAVDPTLSSGGGTNTWWQDKYGYAPDPALALPYRYWPREGFAVQDQNKLYQTKEIFNDPSKAATGDTVLTTVRIHNYSLIPTNGIVNVSFYIGDPDSGGILIKSISGDSIFSTSGQIPSRGSALVSFRWIAPSAINHRFLYNGDYTRIWAYIDPQNTLAEIHKNNNRGWSILEVPGVITDVKNKISGSHMPLNAQLYPNYPNPFNPSTTIQYYIPKMEKVRLIVYDILGQKIAELVNGNQTAGNHTVNFNANNYSSGVYLYSLETEGYFKTRKMILLK